MPRSNRCRPTASRSAGSATASSTRGNPDRLVVATPSLSRWSSRPGAPAGGPHDPLAAGAARRGVAARPGVQVVQLVRGRHTEGLVTAVGSMVLFGLVLARLNGLAGEVAALADARKRLLDRTVQAREEERIRLAAELHDGPIQRLTGAAYAADLSRRRPAAGDGRAAPSGPGRVGAVGGPPQPLRPGQHAPAARDGRRQLAGPLPP